jgi:hypothetical protein
VFPALTWGFGIVALSLAWRWHRRRLVGLVLVASMLLIIIIIVLGGVRFVFVTVNGWVQRRQMAGRDKLLKH